MPAYQSSDSSDSRHAAAAWLNGNWQYAGLIGGCFYLAMLPLLRGPWTIPELLLYLQLPIYIGHELEEHLHDRFRQYVNTRIGHGLELLTPGAVTIINLIGVWCVDLAAIYLARFYASTWGLMAFYLAIVNAVLHILAALGTREYNPGLVTALVLLLPAGCWGVIAFSRSHAISIEANVVCCLIVAALHVAIVAYVLRRRVVLVAALHP